MLLLVATAVTRGGSELFGVAGAGQRLGPGAVGHRHSSSRASPGTNKMVWPCTEPCCLPQWAPCPQPETLTHPPRQAEGGGGEGRERAWPRALAGLAGSPRSGPAFHFVTICPPAPTMSSLLLALKQASQVIFLGHRPLPFLWHPLAFVHFGSSHPPYLCPAGHFPS